MKPLSHVEALAAEEQSFQAEIHKLEEEIELCPAIGYHQRPPRPHTDAGLRRALEEIKRDEGRVCENFELCTHAACKSSYAAWAIADKALSE